MSILDSLGAFIAECRAFSKRVARSFHHRRVIKLRANNGLHAEITPQERHKHDDNRFIEAI